MKIYALAAVATLMVTPASAKMMGCTGADMMKMNTMSAGMPMSQQKMMMDKEMMMASSSMSKGDMRRCSMHMMRAQKAGMMKTR